MFKKFAKFKRSESTASTDNSVLETHSSAVSPRQLNRTTDSSSSSSLSSSPLPSIRALQHQICPPLVIHASDEKRFKPEMFIVKALEKILCDRDIRKSHNSQLRKACEEALGMLLTN